MNSDYTYFADHFSKYASFSGCRFLITGATGLIGKAFVWCLYALNVKHNLGISIICPIRNYEKAKKVLPQDSAISFVDMLLTKELLDGVDYVVHGACPTASRFMVENPVEMIETAYSITNDVLKAAKDTGIKGMVLLSSLEVYGTITDDDLLITEDVQGYIDPLSVRSSYPMTKRLCETLCCSYAKEYGLPVRIARLTQTFGNDVSLEDNRVFAQFARCVVNGEDIVLRTEGRSSKPYLYSIDAVSGILYILLKGVSGEVYNVANPDTYISIRDLANYFVSRFNSSCHVLIKKSEGFGYAPETHLRLDVRKIKELGWECSFGMDEMFSNLVNGVRG